MTALHPAVPGLHNGDTEFQVAVVRFAGLTGKGLPS